MNTKSMLLAGGLAGVAMALLGAIPLIGITNTCCCLWVGIWGSGILAVLIYRMSEKAQPGLTVGQGAILGVVAGLVGAVLVSILGVITSVLFAGANTAAYADMIKQLQGMSDTIPPEYTQMLEQYTATTGNVLVSSLCNFVIYPVFGVIGGVIGTAIIWKK
jgi:hypothetical protein